jgi:hypothetical protein
MLGLVRSIDGSETGFHRRLNELRRFVLLPGSAVDERGVSHKTDSISREEFRPTLLQTCLPF